MAGKPRLQRLFAADGKCFDVAVDHGVFNNADFLAGIEDLPGAICKLLDAAPDAIQLGPGQARLLQYRPRPKPALVLRADCANATGTRVQPACLPAQRVARGAGPSLGRCRHSSEPLPGAWTDGTLPSVSGQHRGGAAGLRALRHAAHD